MNLYGGLQGGEAFSSFFNVVEPRRCTSLSCVILKGFSSHRLYAGLNYIRGDVYEAQIKRAQGSTLSG